MSDFENLDVILGNDSINPIERDLSNVIGISENLCDTESNSQFGEINSQGNGFRHYLHENIIPGQDRFQETMENFTDEFNMWLSQAMDSLMSMLNSQINRTISSAIAARVIPEIQNIVNSMSSSANGTLSLVCPQIVRRLEKIQMGLNLKLRKRTVGLLLI